MIRRLCAAIALAGALSACSPKAEGPPPDPRLDKLFVELRGAPDAEAALKIETQIWERWRSSGSPTVDILLERATIAQAHGQPDLALQLLDEAEGLAPDFAEIWNRRAAIAYEMEDRAAALQAIHETLTREPRHFGALAGLGLIFETLGKQDAALEAYEAALKQHPHFEPARQGQMRLKSKIAGREA